MGRGRAFSILAALLLILVLAGGLLTQRERIAAWWRHRTVKKLLDPAERERVYKEIVAWQRYRSVPRYTIDPPRAGERIHDVIVCPQRNGRPFYVVVFSDAGWPDTDGQRHFELVDFDGTLVPVWSGDNTAVCDFKDLNGDGVADRLSSIVVVYEDLNKSVGELALIPMTPEQKPALRIVYRMRAGDDRWEWTVLETNGGLPEISLGPWDPVTKELSPRAIYRWDPSRSEYAGPSGGIDQDSLRVDDDDEKMAEFVLRES